MNLDLRLATIGSSQLVADELLEASCLFMSLCNGTAYETSPELTIIMLVIYSSACLRG